MTRQLLFFWGIGILVIIMVILPSGAVAFSPHYLLNDSEFQDSTAWGLPEVRNFLETKGSPLSRYAPRDVDGSLKRAADIIVIAARKHRINPKVLLVLLQKEQSLIEHELPITNYQLPGAKRRLDWATGYGICDDCRKNDPRLQVFRGFAQQVDFAAQRLRYFFDHPKEFKILPGKTVRIDRRRVTPLSRATAALYLYTPHINGNRNFWIIWNRWFEQLYPEGSIVENRQDQTLWYITKGRRKKIDSLLLRAQYSAQSAIAVLPEELLKYPESSPMKAAPFAVVRAPNAVVWLLLATERRRIADAQTLKTIGYNPEEIESVSTKTLQEYPEGLPITDALTASAVSVLKTPTTPTVYLLDRGKKRPIQSARAFESLGYRWNQIVTVAEDVAAHYPTGNPIDVATEDLGRALEEFRKE